MSIKAHLVAGVTLVAIGAGIGSCSAMSEDEGGSAQDAAPAPAPTKTEVVTKTHKVSEMPPSCVNVLKALKGIKADEDNLINIYLRGADVLSDGHEALTSSDGSALNEARTKLYRLDAETNKSAQNLQLHSWPDLERDLKTCKQTDAYKGGQ